MRTCFQSSPSPDRAAGKDGMRENGNRDPGNRHHHAAQEHLLCVSARERCSLLGVGQYVSRWQEWGPAGGNQGRGKGGESKTESIAMRALDDMREETINVIQARSYHSPQTR